MRHADFVRDRTRSLVVFLAALSATVLTGTAAAQQGDPTAVEPTTTTTTTTTTTATTATNSEPGAADGATQLDNLEVTGSRLLREDYLANSPTSTVTRDDIERYSDITLDTFLNTLPQVNPAGTITSNNPGNGGQANVDLRGLGANRNLVLIDGRRPMPSGQDMSIDLNTIPKALIERVEIVTGGAGAVYGADALAGAVNIIMKRKWEGVAVGGSWIDTEDEHDAQDRVFSLALGNNFWDNKANFMFAGEYGTREGLIKSQRNFSQNATATTSFLPEGLYFPSGNAPSQAAIDALFTGYGSPDGFTAGGGAATNSINAPGSLLGFNLDGSLFSRGVFNSPRNVINYGYPVDGTVNRSLYPDVYSYNFDIVNILVLPLERYSGMGKFSFDLGDDGAELFAQTMYTNYQSASALAPSPIHTSNGRAPGLNSPTQWSSPLIVPGGSVTQQLLVPSTNPFIPSDFATLLGSRVGDNANLVGSGATEPFLMRQRTLSAGLRQNLFDTTVWQTLVGLRGPIQFNDAVWNWEAFYSKGKTSVPTTQVGNIDAQRLQGLLEAADGGAGTCTGGFNPFGRQPISQSCLDYLQVVTETNTVFRLDMISAFLRGEIGQLPAGGVQMVVGAEKRDFEFSFDPGQVSGPIDGFNTASPGAGTNGFRDVYTELGLPLIRDVPGAEALDLNFGYRLSRAQFKDGLTGLQSDPATDSAFKSELSWTFIEPLRARASYQRAVRAPNFGELFGGGASAPQYFDPCSATTGFRTNDPNALALCQAVGAGANGDGVAGGAGIASYVQTPGTQINITTSGNTALESEKADTLTAGFVFDSPWGGAASDLSASIDYYQIKINQPILVPDPNIVVASCYNYYGTNPTYSATDPNCGALIRLGPTDILAVLYPGDPVNGLFPGINGGKVKVSGIDLAVNWNVPTVIGVIGFDLDINHVLEFKQQDDPTLPELEYAGTVSYFGQGLGASSPEWKANLLSKWSLGNFQADVRTRYIDAMENRASVQFPGESSLTGTKSMVYWDVGVGYRVGRSMLIRTGLVNLTDEDPPQYRPNVQSGTDPSLFDVYGRRAFLQVAIEY